MNPRAFKIRELRAPAGDLRIFDPGDYLCGLEFYATDEALSENERHGLAQMVHYLAYLSLRSGPERYEASLIPHASSAYAALQTYFGQLQGWDELPRESDALPYRVLVPFLLDHYPPPIRETPSGILGRVLSWWKR